MAINRWQPTTDLFRPILDDLAMPFGRMGSTLRVPDTDVLETEDEVSVVAELPGMNPEDIDVSLENNVLTISGEKKEERKSGEENGTYHLSERRWGRFTRSFVLPREVDQDRIEANFDNGVLRVSIPKSEKARRRRIDIKGDGGSKRIEARSGA